MAVAISKIDRIETLLFAQRLDEALTAAAAPPAVAPDQLPFAVSEILEDEERRQSLTATAKPIAGTHLETSGPVILPLPGKPRWLDNGRLDRAASPMFPSRH